MSQLLNLLVNLEQAKKNLRKLRERDELFQTGMSKLGKLTLSKLHLQGRTSVDVGVFQFVLDKWKDKEKQANN